MRLSELSQASLAHERLNRANRQIDALADYKVVGIVVDRGEGSVSPVRIERGGSSGTGSISSICWDDDLQVDLTKAMHEVFQKRLDSAKIALIDLGVQVD